MADTALVRFPSITVCKDKAYDAYMSKLLEYSDTSQPASNISTEEVRAWVLRHSWDRERIFKLVAHGNAGRPCMTNNGAWPGKPCSFPFVFPDCNVFPQPGVCAKNSSNIPRIYTDCTTCGSNGPWCPTKTHSNNSQVVGEWGE
jgi:hypothetical protein